MPAVPAEGRLKKSLTLFDVYAVSTGAMFSSGFFLLPGLAAGITGPSVPLAYAVAALFILPAMFSVAELGTAMPRAGGAYYFLDRALGPMVGTVGGLGTWLALVLKSAFALVGMGAYLAIFFDVPIQPLAAALTLVFTLINVVGAKETTGLQRVLVVVLVVILTGFVVQGLGVVAGQGPAERAERFSDPFLLGGITGLMATAGLVFVSYAGLTKVASIAEEVQNPERNIPLGMMLSLATAVAIYVLGSLVIVAVVPAETLRDDLTPVASAANAVLGWMPGQAGLLLIVVAAVAAFASTGNAGIMAASRYPLAMARDRLLWARLAEVGRFGTPTASVLATGAAMLLFIVALDVAGIAKLASAFQLLLFALLNLAVVVMRESRIEAYDPGFRSPFYPWMQIAGFLSPLWLIAEMGEMALLFTLGLVALCVGWWLGFARSRVEREGAILHAFARFGERRFVGLETELRGIVREKGLREEDPYEEVVARAAVIDLAEPAEFDAVAERAAARLAGRVDVTAERLTEAFCAGTQVGAMPVAHGFALPHARFAEVDHPEMVLVRAREGVGVEGPGAETVRALVFLAGPADDPGLHLRLLAALATAVDAQGFAARWMAARDDADLREALLRDDRHLALRVGSGPAAGWAGRTLRELELPSGTLVALVRRDGYARVPHGGTRLEAGDRLTLIGEPEGLGALGGAPPDGDGRDAAGRAPSSASRDASMD